MPLFLELFLKILPLYLIIYFGYIAANKLNVNRESISPLLLYIIFPIVCFKGIMTTKITATTLSYPIYFFAVGTLMAFSFYAIGKFVFKDKEIATLLALASSLANVGYYGLPVALIIFGDKVLGTVVLLTMGLGFYESTFGFFLAASGKHSIKEAFMRTLKLPTLYITAFAVLANLANEHFQFLSPNFMNGKFTAIIYILVIAFAAIIDKVLGAYTLLGNMIVGLAFENSSHRGKIDYRFLALTFVAQFIVYPAIAFVFIFLDNHYLHLYSKLAHQVIMIMSLVPAGANTIVFATEMRYKIHTVAVTVLASTIFALFYIPLFMTLLWKWIKF